MNQIAKMFDPTSEGGQVIATGAKVTMLHGKLVAAGSVMITNPRFPPRTLTKGGGSVTVENLPLYNRGDSPLLPEGEDALVG